MKTPSAQMTVISEWLQHAPKASGQKRTPVTLYHATETVAANAKMAISDVILQRKTNKPANQVNGKIVPVQQL